MASVLYETTKFAVDQGFTGGALAGIGALLDSLVELVRELHGSKEMCEDLISDVRSIIPQLETMQKNDNIKTSKDVLTAYETLLREVEFFLQNHKDSKLWERVIKHWKMKKRVQQFYVDLRKIKNLLGLKHQEETANWHGVIQGMLDQNLKLYKQTQAALSDDLRKIMTLIETMPSKFVDDIGQDKSIAVTDLKQELKVNYNNYTKTQIKMIHRIYKVTTTLAPDTHLEPWYLCRSDFDFSERSPFTTGKFRSIHYGTLISGAEVTIKTVMAEMGDEVIRDQFIKEVEKWYKLRDPHVLPLYGANNRDSPMVFVCGRAEFGNFNEYLSTHPHRFWQVFLDAARGLAYLHRLKIVHGNLKCNNLLVTKHGVGVLSDFAFAFVRSNSTLSLKAQTPDHFWKAPECFPPQEKSSNPQFKSDVYSLGMCIFEAMSGVKPFAEIEEQDAIERIKKGELPHRPDGKFTDEAWNLITEMCSRSLQDRISLDDCIGKMQLLAEWEQEMCSQNLCNCMTPYCLECGGQRRFTSSEGVPARSTSDAAPAAG